MDRNLHFFSPFQPVKSAGGMFCETTEALLNVCIAPVGRAVGSASPPKLPCWRAAMTTSGCPAARTKTYNFFAVPRAQEAEQKLEDLSLCCSKLDS